MILKTIYVGNRLGEYHEWVEENAKPMSREGHDAWWYPEIEYDCYAQAKPRHPARIIRMVPEILKSPHRKVVTMSEHLILAIQQLVRRGELGHNQIEIYCGRCKARLNTKGDFAYWPGDFFPERLELL